MKKSHNDIEKWCPHCEKMLPLEMFGIDKHSKSGRDGYCKVHRREYSKKYHPRRRDYMRATRYGLSKEDYEKIFKDQDGKCAICLSEGKLCVDHDHKTGLVRGLLCSGCNVMLGHFDDDIELFSKVIEYLTKSKLTLNESIFHSY